MSGADRYGSGLYWAERSDLLYYRAVDYILRCVGAEARSLLDVGTGNCPYPEWWDWIGERVSVDTGTPYASAAVRGIRGDIHALEFPGRFDICTCLQVLEHVPEAGAFARRLLELADLVVISVPFEWPVARRTAGHVHDPVTRDKLAGWTGRAPNWEMVVAEPFEGAKARRLIALYDRDPARRFDAAIKAGRRLRPDPGATLPGRAP